MYKMAGYTPPQIRAPGGVPSIFNLAPTLCPLCFTHLDEFKTLTCGHTFCKRCLNQRADGNLLSCPTCKKVMDLGDHGLDGLQPNYLINNILELVTSPDDVQMRSGNGESIFQSHWSTELSDIAQTVCETGQDDLTAMQFCANCGIRLCVNCAAAHQRSPRSSGHQLLPINPSTVHPNPQTDNCSKHPSNDLGYFCNTCIHKVCEECLIFDHAGHNLAHLQKAAQELRNILPTIASDLKMKQDSVNNVLTQVDHVMDSIDAQARSANGEIEACIRQNISALEEKQRELLNQVECVRRLKHEILGCQKQELIQVKSQLAEVNSVVLNAQSIQNDSDILTIKRDLQLKINKIQQEIAQLKNSHEDDQLGFSQRDHALKNSIAQIGVVTSGVSSIHTTASGQGIFCAIVGKCSKFLVTCRNHLNQRLSQPSETLDVTIFGPDGKQLVVDPVAKHDGMFQFSYYPNLIGVHTISILIRGRHITGSPMKATVRKRRNYFNIGAAHHTIGGDGEKEGQLCRPWGVCCDPNGHIIVADRSNNRVQVFNPDGTYSHMFGETGCDPGQFNRPAGVTVNSKNQIIVTDKDNHRVQIFTFKGQFLRAFGERGSLNGHLHYPWDVACNSEDYILVSDTRNHRIQLFSPEGHYLNKFNFHAPPHQRVQLPQPRGVCFTESGDILVTDFNKHRLMFIKSNFQSVQMFGSEGQGNGQFFRPQGVSVDLEGNILVSEGRNNRVQIFKPDGTFLTKFGGLGTGDEEFDRPSGICVTPDGYIVVVDFGNNRIMFF